MAPQEEQLLVALAVVLILILAAWAWERGKKKKPTTHAASAFCGSAPDPAAMSEAAGLHELGVRMSGASRGSGGSSRSRFCGTTPAPAALAEYEGLRQLGWREGMQATRPTCGPPAPAAIAEAQALQHADALRPGAPYYTKSSFRGAPPPAAHGCATAGQIASGEAALLRALQALPEGRDGEGMDVFASRQLTRDRAARAGKIAHAAAARANPAHTPARQARLDSMREGFGGPAEPGFGWSPTAPDVAASPATGGWGPGAFDRAGRAMCARNCVEGCTGTHCADLCAARCARASS